MKLGYTVCEIFGKWKIMGGKKLSSYLLVTANAGGHKK